MLERWEKTVVFRGRDESSQCFVYSFVSGQKSPFLPYAPILYGLYIWYILSDIQRVRA